MWGKNLLLVSTAAVGVHSISGANNVAPCAQIATLQSQSASTFPAETAFGCLNSVPVDVEGDKKLIDNLKITWQWHSDITWLKDPPTDWENGALDLVAELDQIKKDLGKYKSEFQVQLAIQNITVRSGDFHFNYNPDILQVFQWKRKFSIVALSDDGLAVPKFYMTVDALKVADGNVTEDKISNIVKINGNDTWPYLENLAKWEQYRDTDGRLNSLLAKGDTLSPGAFMHQSRFDGADTNITFANGTSLRYINTAVTNKNFTSVKDGRSFYEKFCQGDDDGAPAGNNDQSVWKPTYSGKLGEGATIPKGEYHSSRLRKREIVPARFPKAVVEATTGAVAGYFLDGEGYADIAVLKIMSFLPKNDPYGLEFQAVVSQFLNLCQAAAKNRLIIDLRENGGGSVQVVLDTFRQLFPHRNPWQGARYRATPHFKLIGDAASEIHNNGTLYDQYQEQWNGTVDEHFRYWGYSHYLDAQGKNFESWEQFKGPELFHDDQYTTTWRYNLSNEDSISVRVGDFNFTDPSNRKTVFNHTEIVMFTDALCGSACAAFHEEFKNNVGIRSVTVGGRAIEGPIQAVSGAKGGEVVPLMQPIVQAELMRNVSRTLRLKSYPSDETTLDDLIDTPELQKRAGDGASRVQVQSRLRKGDKSSTPLQFVYEAADCKIFYTHESFVDPTTIWKQVWDAFLAPESKCVKGSTGHKSSISGGFVPYGPWLLKDEDLPVPQGQEANKTSEAAVQESQKPKAYEGTGSRIGASAAMLCVTVAAIMTQL